MPYTNLDDMSYFFLHVPRYLLDRLSLFEKILISADIKDEIFKKAVKLGYDRKDGERIKGKIVKNLLHSNFPQFEVELLEKNYYQTALANLIQERINNGEVFPENLKILDWLIARYDPITPEFYLQTKPDFISIPEYNENTWISSLDMNLEKDIVNSPWVTLYSQVNFHLKKLGASDAYETNNLLTAFAKTGNDEKIDVAFDELYYDTFCNNINGFKNLKLNVKEQYPFFPFLIVNKNKSDFQCCNTLVRIDQKFKTSAKLQWDENSVLNMRNEKSIVINYQSWHSSYYGDPYSRFRIAHGVRLEIDRNFLIEYLQHNKLSLFVLENKERRLVDESFDNHDLKNHKKSSQQKIFTASELVDLVP